MFASNVQSPRKPPVSVFKHKRLCASRWIAI